MSRVNDMEILREELKQEAYQELSQEYKLRSDYEYFLEFYSPQVNDLLDEINYMKQMHEMYGYEFDLGMFGDMV